VTASCRGDTLRFDGRVFVITGAGRGLGRAYALLLAARGAAVVVNDLGVGVDGGKSDENPVAEVVNRIVACGGRAIGSTADVASPDSAETIVAAALDEFGGIDGVVNNAGIIARTAFPETTYADFGRHTDVHLGGAFNVTRAAWPHMVKRGYGRVVLTTSASVFGSDTVAYASAKAGVIGLGRSLALAGKLNGIRVNIVAPFAAGRMARGPMSVEADPAQVAPLVAFLVHEDCPVTGEVYAAGCGRFARWFLAENEGIVDPHASVETVRARWDDINDLGRYWCAPDVRAYAEDFVGRVKDASRQAQR
jgi:NAD(P)-dependent dehydrogenase (short-subunit alcohol dehydrogenase family)